MRMVLFAAWLIAGLLLFLGGCRVSLTADKVNASVAIDAPQYLSKEDPGLYYEPDNKSDERADDSAK